jgi:hypothetical protein
VQAEADALFVSYLNGKLKRLEIASLKAEKSESAFNTEAID